MHLFAGPITYVPTCYFPKNVQIVSIQLHGFSDGSKDVYAGVVYLRMEDTDGTFMWH